MINQASLVCSDAQLLLVLVWLVNSQALHYLLLLYAVCTEVPALSIVTMCAASNTLTILLTCLVM
jgi:hypothetical protein